MEWQILGMLHPSLHYRIPNCSHNLVRTLPHHHPGGIKDRFSHCTFQITVLVLIMDDAFTSFFINNFFLNNPCARVFFNKTPLQKRWSGSSTITKNIMQEIIVVHSCNPCPCFPFFVVNHFSIRLFQISPLCQTLPPSHLNANLVERVCNWLPLGLREPTVLHDFTIPFFHSVNKSCYLRGIPREFWCSRRCRFV